MAVCVRVVTQRRPTDADRPGPEAPRQSVADAVERLPGRDHGRHRRVGRRGRQPVYRKRPPRITRRPAMGDQRVPAGDCRHADSRRETRGPFRPPAGLLDRRGRVLTDLCRHRVRRNDRRSHRPSRYPRRIRGLAPSQHLGSPQSGLPARRAQPRRWHLGERHGHSNCSRTDHRWHLRRAILMAERVLHQPPDRDCRSRRRSGRIERDKGVGAPEVRHTGGDHPCARAPGHRLRAGECPKLGLGQRQHSGSDRNRRGLAASSLS